MIVIAAAAGAAQAAVPREGPQPVSPGGEGVALAVASACPTLSWAEKRPGDHGYELAVYFVEEDGSLRDQPALRVEVPAGGSSFTPSGARCLEPGRYAWAVRPRGGTGEGTAWSAPLFFSVAPPSEELERTVERVLERWLQSGRLADRGGGPISGLLGPQRSAATRRGLSSLPAASFAPPDCDPEASRIFGDVLDTNPACPWIEQMYVDGLTSGCADDPLRFCPEDPVRRDQLAAMLGKATHEIYPAICPFYEDPAIACSDVPAFCASGHRPDCCPVLRKTVFRSSLVTNGNLIAACNGLALSGCTSGLDSADAICQHLASQAGLSGTYKAWLSDDSVGPSTRFIQSATRPYCRVDNTRVADDWADLIACPGDVCLAAPINLTESGGLAQSPAWSYTQRDGTPFASGFHCAGWSDGTNTPFGLTGAPDNVDPTWTEPGGTGCGNPNGLYCFEQ